MTDEIALLIMTDGRNEMLQRTLQSFSEQVTGNIKLVFVNDDSGSRENYDWLSDNVRRYLTEHQTVMVHGTGGRQGFGGAIRSAWKALASLSESVSFDWVFHLEDDFTFPEPVDLADIQNVMMHHSYLAQMALRRQPWGSDLPWAGGFIEAQPDHYTERHEPGLPTWIETRRNWTTNPSLFRRELLAAGWPGDPFSEGKYGFELKERGLPWGIEGNEVQFGIWGGIYDAPRCWHIGDYRVGTLY